MNNLQLFTRILFFFSVEENNEENLKHKLAANIEKDRIAMSRLEEIFVQNPSLQTTDVMRKLLEVYKDCRQVHNILRDLVVCFKLLKTCKAAI